MRWFKERCLVCMYPKPPISTALEANLAWAAMTAGKRDDVLHFQPHAATCMFYTPPVLDLNSLQDAIERKRKDA